jgi:site-specific recombinase XerD
MDSDFVSALAPTPAPSKGRKLSAAHFAFMRGLVQGLPVRETWERYLHVEGSSSDMRVVRSTIQWMRDAFAAAARREDRFGTARLVLVDISRLPQAPPLVPSLEEFAAARGLDDFSQAEQIEAFEAEYGKANQRQSRRSRLISKQLDALRWLESLVAQPPGAGDAVAAWLNPRLAGHLEAAGLFTLAQLLERINGVGRGWTSSIKGIGTAKAERVVQWLIQNEVTIGMSVGKHVALPRSALCRHELQELVRPATDVRPLEKLIVPAELDGSGGAFRRPQSHCLLSASNDYAAILAWIQSKLGVTPEQKARARARRRGRESGIEDQLEWMQYLSHTQRAYRKEAERYLLWAIVEKRKPLSSMTVEDCVEYRKFLADPQPQSRWCAQRNRERWSPLWRPFEGPLSPAAQRQSITILRGLYAFWVDQNYVMGNPWTGVKVPRSSQPKVNASRSFTTQQWDFIGEQLALQPNTSSARRLRFGIRLLYATGLRISEVVAARVDDLGWVEYGPDADDQEPVEGWMLSVVGKGQRLRHVPVPLGVVAELASYLESRGLHPNLDDPSNAGAHLLGKAVDVLERAPQLAPGAGVEPKSGISANTLYDQVKRFFGDCGAVLRGRGDERGAGRFQLASTHWLRHSHASHSIACGTPIEVAKDVLGHTSLATTTVYVATEQKRRMRALAPFWDRSQRRS